MCDLKTKEQAIKVFNSVSTSFEKEIIGKSLNNSTITNLVKIDTTLRMILDEGTNDDNIDFALSYIVNNLLKTEIANLTVLYQDTLAIERCINELKGELNKEEFDSNLVISIVKELQQKLDNTKKLEDTRTLEDNYFSILKKSSEILVSIV